ncbi:MAG: nuclear transport factor 2 family protein [Acidobacteriota bacterium]|nr:nuclear transport factor 2 family protein [Acidobacteriota bacterium]
MSAQEVNATKRREQLRAIAERYFESLRRKDFSAIPYDDNVTLRAPLTPGGVNQPLVGKEALRTQWWQPLGPALEGVQIKVFEHYINEAMTAIVTESEIKINVVDPPATLRVADRFTVDEQGKIIEQENHFDPRDVTNPGWQKG